MRRWPAAAANSRMPEKLRRFVPAEWPGETEWRQYEAWESAEGEWVSQHPEDLGTAELPPDVAWDPAVDPP